MSSNRIELKLERIESNRITLKFDSIRFDSFGTLNEIPNEEEILSSFEQIEEEETILNEIIVPNVSISEAVKAFKTAFKFLEQNNLQADYDELRALNHWKKR